MAGSRCLRETWLTYHRFNRFLLIELGVNSAIFADDIRLCLEGSRVITSFVLHNLPPEIVIVSGGKSILIMRPVFGEYYNQGEGAESEKTGNYL